MSDMTNEFLHIFLEEAIDILSDWEKHCLALEIQNSPDTLSALFRSAHNLKGSARSVGLSEYGKFIHKAEDLITLLRDGRLPPDSSIMRSLLDTHSVLSDWRDKLTVDPTYVPAQAVEQLTEILSRLILSADQVNKVKPTDTGFGFFEDEVPVVLAPASTSIQEELKDSEPSLKKEESRNKSSSKVKGTRSNESIRIPANRIDGLMQLIGELSIQQSTILHALKNNELHQALCHKAIHIAAKLTRELQLQTMGLRLTDIGKLFQKLERTARDLATDQGKSIRIELQGSEVELDKNVIEKVSDALVHMVRNAVDHGIEYPKDRSTKAELATICLSAFQSASGVTIQIQDDGKGIDQERVLNKGKSLGLVRDSEKLNPSQIYDLMFAPGFSTASQVTEVSGRGVGLDVVKRTITDLGGSIDIQSELGKGSTFSISLPLTVSIVDSLVIISGGTSYVVPIQEISEVIDMSSFETQTQFKKAKSVSLREKSLNILPLQNFIPLKGQGTVASAEVSRTHPVMVIEYDGQKIGFGFEKIIGQQPILIRQLADYITDIPGFAGNTVLANGEPAIILSPKIFAQQYLARKDRAS